MNELVMVKQYEIMFRKGDIVICIDNSKLIIGGQTKVETNIPYEIIEIKYYRTLMILYFKNIPYGIYPHRFISLSEYRKRKINKILKNKNYDTRKFI